MSIKQIKDLIEEGNSLKYVAAAYSEVSSLKLARIRGEVERNRLFYNEIGQVYDLIRKVASQKKIQLKPKPKKVLSIAITSNYRFFGSINNSLLRYFLIQTVKYPSDKLIIGKTGQEHLKGIHYFHSYKGMTLKTDFPNDSELKELGQIINQYEQVLVYHTELKTVLDQKPVVKDITKKQNTNQTPEQLQNLGYIVEPEIEQMIAFFDEQIQILLLEQAFLDAELSRTAARLVAMDEAQNNAEDFVKGQKRFLAQEDRSVKNIRLLETINAILSRPG